MKRYERLGLNASQVDVSPHLRVLEMDLSEKTESDYDAAWRKHGRAIGRARVALLYYLRDDQALAVGHAKHLLPAAEEFFLVLGGRHL